jgi:hypothetical protein
LVFVTNAVSAHISELAIFCRFFGFCDWTRLAQASQSSVVSLAFVIGSTTLDVYYILAIFCRFFGFCDLPYSGNWRHLYDDLAIFCRFFGFCDYIGHSCLDRLWDLAIFCRLFGFCDKLVKNPSGWTAPLAIFCRFFGFCDKRSEVCLSQSSVVSLVFATFSGMSGSTIE